MSDKFLNKPLNIIKFTMSFSLVTLQLKIFIWNFYLKLGDIQKYI